MTKLDIEFKQSSTGSYSPWHLEIIDKYDVSLICTADIGYFVKVGNDIYKIYYSNDYYDLYDYVCNLEKKNKNGELSDNDVLSLVNIALDNPKKISKCESLEELEDYLIRYKNKKHERRKRYSIPI